GHGLASKFARHQVSAPLSLRHLHHAGLSGGAPLFHDLTNLGRLWNWLHQGQTTFGTGHAAKPISETTGVAGQSAPAQASGKLDLSDILKQNGLIPPSSS